MKNSQLFPFERNRYYAGKVLTSTDFVAEQLYMNNKRRFMNNIMYGFGVVCGLNVINLDDMSILIESGVAIDGVGREIVVDSSVVKKLSTLEGFDQLSVGKASLCIRYKETEVHPVYCVSNRTVESATQDYECNRIEEGYELYLVKEASGEAVPFEIDDEFLYEETILDNEDFLLKLRIPVAVPKGKAVKLVIEVLKKTNHPVSLSFHALFQMPVFTDPNGRHELEIDLPSLELAEGETICYDYWVNAEVTDLTETNLIARKEQIQIISGDHMVEVDKDISIKLQLETVSPEELATREIGKMNLEMRNVHQLNDQIKLAEINFINMGASLIVESIKEHGIKKYIATPGETYHRSRYLSYFKSPEKRLLQQFMGRDIPNVSDAVSSPVKMTSGRVEIPLRVNMKKGSVCYSEEIMHGLGRGNVYVAVGLEDQSQDVHFNKTMQNTIYGNASLFENSINMELETAVKVMNDKGSFQIAVKLLGGQKSIIVAVNWVAIKFDLEDTVDAGFEDMRIVAENPTVRLGAGDNYFFEVHFENMQPCKLSYELTEAGSGEISDDGVYTAPSREGVYEIRIYCTDQPKVSTYVYAIVSK